jgi:hypothetical protein
MLSKKTLEKEFKRRQAAAISRPVEDDTNYGPQNAFVNDTSRYITAQCSRRAGKSNGLGKRFFKTMERYPGSTCIYLGLTRDSARSIMWPVLQELDIKYGIGCEFIESKLLVKHPNGAALQLYGADMKNVVKRLRGRKAPGIGVDEAQDFGEHLQSLIDDVLTPMMADYSDPWLALTGTPGPVPQGYFFNVTQERKYGYSFHEWTIFDNPYIPNAKEFLDDLKKKREWDDNHPTLRREWLNQWVLDVKSLWIQYNASKNHYDILPKIGNHYILGIDVGYRDADALAVLAHNDNSKDTYLVEELITAKQGLTELVAQIKHLEKKYNIYKMVIDEGGLGKKLAEEMRRQHSIPVEGADKLRKQENVEFLNDSLRRGTFKAKSDSKFAKDSYLVQIDWEKSTPNRIIVKKHPHSDIIDAVLYAFKVSPAWSYEIPVAPLKKGTKEWADAQEDEMWDEANKHFTEMQERDKRLKGEWED